MEFRNYTTTDYEALCDFLIALNRDDRRHINWNWARLEWMYEHPQFDKSTMDAIGLWLDGGRIVGAAIYDMYFGEAFCGALSGYEDLYPAILSYAYRELGDESGVGVSVCDDSAGEIEALRALGFELSDQDETVMSIPLDGQLPVEMPQGFTIEELDPAQQADDFQWLLWQGFDHGTDRTEFEVKETIVPQVRPHFDRSLSLTAVSAGAEKTAYCCLWYQPGTDYAYVEPVCTVPSYRGRGIARALIHEALNRAGDLGARRAYVISDTEFYQRLGFTTAHHFSFYWKL